MEMFGDFRGLIFAIYEQYTLAAALVTLVFVVAAYVFIGLDDLFELLRLPEQRRPKKLSSQLVLLFGIWVVLVPLVGVAIQILWVVLKAVGSILNFLYQALASSYQIYNDHPVFVLVLIFIAAILFVAWYFGPKKTEGGFGQKETRKVLPWHPAVVISLLVVLVVIVAHIGAPLVALFDSAEDQQQQGPQIKNDE